MAPKKTRKPRATVNPDETAEQKFTRLANKRVSKVLNDLKLVGNLAKYSHSPEQATKIMEAIDAAVGNVERSFSAPAAKERPTFTL